MMRDMNLMRLLMLELEKIEIPGGGTVSMSDVGEALPIEGYTADQVRYHFRLIAEDSGWIVGGTKRFSRITAAGHDFLDAVRDEDIWRMTREGALQVKGFTTDLLIDLAKGYLKNRIRQFTNIEI
ncbi:DUF2513 domain-containing protein [Pseudomonas arcuscaelestis]|uniref:DUF2513 domain-containing protein n=1 Tax=Pseudomonas arcuscaelestis TaxID=2710591 RepID=UPI00193E6B7B|nr:DUF2513 domain-containing protein [Pseudomonas arcuscaelestis]MBM3113280.1 DUF2513 domain-containing protein [Pseudomonas arcuscaelestis]